jgi:aminopeptidase
MDQRINRMAKQLIRHSVNLKKGEKILIDINDYADDYAVALIKEVYAVEGIPFINLESSSIKRAILMGASEEQMEKYLEYELGRMRDMDAYIAVRKSENASELSDIPKDRLNHYNKFYGRLHLEERVKNTKWCVLRYPNASMAQQAKMSTEAFEEYYFKVCNLDYRRMSKAMDPLVALMEKTNKVRLVAQGTDLSFSIKGINVVKCDGKCNIPDGEVYSAPVRDSVNGAITFNTPSVYKGYTYDNIRLEFKDGKIVNAMANDTERINKVFDTDEGARYVGEFAIGVNPYISKPMKETLFDEKIRGSIHFTPGNCVPGCNNNNKSKIHWDLVLIQTPEFGGGEILFDNQLVRKDGLFVLPELQGLNPENLK